MSDDSSTAVQPFDFRGNSVRVIMIDGEPWFVAADVCAAITVSDVSTALSRLDQQDKGQTRITASDGRNRVMWLISESGLYELIIRSDKAEAREFRRWITSEVLPSIRKTGGYQALALDPLDMLQGMLDTLRQQRADLAELGQRQDLHERAILELGSRTEALEASYERYSATGYASVNGLRGDVVYLNRLGRAAATVARRDCIPIEKVHSTIFGTVNAWPVEVWDEAYRIVGP